MQSNLKGKTRLDSKAESPINCLTLENDCILKALILMEQITSSSRGPGGKIKIVQNSLGGHLTLTSTSTRLLNAMSFTNPMVKLITSSAQGHLKKFNDAGHLMMSVSLNLILQSLKLGTSRRILTDLYEIFLGMCADYIQCKTSSPIKIDVMFSDLKQMSSIVKSILISKPLCQFAVRNLKLCSDLLLETFLMSLPNCETVTRVSDSVNVVALQGQPIEKSNVLQGLLLQCPEIVSHSNQILNVNTVENEDSTFHCLVALVTASMSGDSEEVGSMQYESDISVDTDYCILGILEDFCDKLTAANVGLLLCQRVVHPRLKYRLQQQSIVVVERLGVTMTPYIQDVSGAVPIRSFHNLDTEVLGKVASVEHQIFLGKSYMLLSPLQDKCVVSLVLYSQEEEQLSELKMLCSTCLLSLRQLVQSPHALLGAGCWQTHLAAMLNRKVKANQVDIIRRTGCTVKCLTQACKVFTNTLQKIAAMGTGHDRQDHMSDLEHGHLWRLPKGSRPDPDAVLRCSCGAVKQRISKLFYLSETPDIVEQKKLDQTGHSKLHTADTDVILDLSAPCVAALTSGVLTANTVLSIGQFIQDIN
ncbi:molecular chaperone MKKS-like [Ylistrum balloti]|uniref:molecular chaperone MKKS-like n=1 Tax=Ylistrum balloti TaxID=509963 RepID=UPI002905A42C|nr:molecular chaperone MKKS-like [Ylistrum balloti]